MKLRKILKQLVQENITYQIAQVTRKASYPSKMWLNEFCTIKLTTHRQAGHTTAGMNLAENFTDSVFITGNSSSALNVRRLNKNLNVVPIQKFDSDSEYLKNILDGMIDDTLETRFPYSIIIVDWASFIEIQQKVSLSNLKDLCGIISKKKEIVLVLLQ